MHAMQMERLEQHKYITSAWDNPLSKPIVSLYCFFSFSIFSSSNNYVVSLTKTWKSTIECSKFKRNCMMVIPDEIIIMIGYSKTIWFYSYVTLIIPIYPVLRTNTFMVIRDYSSFTLPKICLNPENDRYSSTNDCKKCNKYKSVCIENKMIIKINSKIKDVRVALQICNELICTSLSK